MSSTNESVIESPTDPRISWQLPAFGQLPVLAELDELAWRVLAPNPSPMTLDGTNTYVIAAPEGGPATIVDPGPLSAAHLHRVRDVLARRDAFPMSIVVTHHHLDHAAAASSWGSSFGCPVIAATPEVAGQHGRLVRDGDRIEVGSVSIDVVATPGHTRDHLAFRLPTGAVLTGDHVLGRGTSVVAHPDGDLAAYLHSLRRLLRMGPDALYPGHGPELEQDSGAVLTYYEQHREFRRAQIIALLAQGVATPAELVASIYADADRRLWSAAEASTRATLAMLEDERRVHQESDRFQL